MQVQSKLNTKPLPPGPPKSVTPPGLPVHPAKPTAPLPDELDVSGIEKLGEEIGGNAFDSSTPASKKRKASLVSFDGSFFSEFETTFSQSSLNTTELFSDKLHRVVENKSLIYFNPEAVKLKTYYNEVSGESNEAISLGTEIYLPSKGREMKTNRCMESLRCGLSACGKRINIGEMFSQVVVLFPECHAFCSIDLHEIPNSHGDGLSVCPIHVKLSREPECIALFNSKVSVALFKFR